MGWWDDLKLKAAVAGDVFSDALGLEAIGLPPYNAAVEAARQQAERDSLTAEQEAELVSKAAQIEHQVLEEKAPTKVLKKDLGGVGDWIDSKVKSITTIGTGAAILIGLVALAYVWRSFAPRKG